jgi:uncharacterized protein YecE (DUF72 family)
MALHVGTCSWTEKTLIQSGEFYPPNVRTAESRLQFYSDRFDTVEVDSTYYAIPTKSNASLWAQRTPTNFVFHIKVYGALTGHAIDPKTLPPDIRSELPEKDKAQNRIYVNEPALLRMIADEFMDALYPLMSAGKLGIIVFQFPPWFIYKHANFDYILRRKELMGKFPVAVEFRHGSWLTPEKRERVLSFLKEHGLAYVTVDEPQFDSLATVPFYPAVTADIAYFRFHGRNSENWLKKNIETALRFAYHYSDDELKSFVPALKETEKSAEKIFVMRRLWENLINRTAKVLIRMPLV